MTESKMYPDWEEILRYNEEELVKEPTTRDQLVKELRALGLEGRHVMVHASYKCLAPVDGGPATVVKAFVEAVGQKGCVLFPTYDFQTWSEHHYWDRQNTPSKMGIITEIARRGEAGHFWRTPHPMLSYAELGTGQIYQRDVPVSHGPDSVFARFMDHRGVLMSIGALTPTNKGFAPHNVGFTFIHHVEACELAPYRMWKHFGGIYVDSGKAEVRCYASFVRCPGYVTQVSLAMAKMEERGVIENVQLGHSRTHIAECSRVYEAVARMVRDEPSLLRVGVT